MADARCRNDGFSEMEVYKYGVLSGMSFPRSISRYARPLWRCIIHGSLEIAFCNLGKKEAKTTWRLIPENIRVKVYRWTNVQTLARWLSVGEYRHLLAILPLNPWAWNVFILRFGSQLRILRQHFWSMPKESSFCFVHRYTDRPSGQVRETLSGFGETNNVPGKPYIGM